MVHVFLCENIMIEACVLWKHNGYRYRGSLHDFGKEGFASETMKWILVEHGHCKPNKGFVFSSRQLAITKKKKSMTHSLVRSMQILFVIFRVSKC